MNLLLWLRDPRKHGNTDQNIFLDGLVFVSPILLFRFCLNTDSVSETPLSRNFNKPSVYFSSPVVPTSRPRKQFVSRLQGIGEGVYSMNNKEPYILLKTGYRMEKPDAFSVKM